MVAGLGNCKKEAEDGGKEQDATASPEAANGPLIPTHFDLELPPELPLLASLLHTMKSFEVCSTNGLARFSVVQVTGDLRSRSAQRRSMPSYTIRPAGFLLMIVR